MENPMVDMMWNVIGQQFAKLPPAAQAALGQTEVHIKREEDRVIIRPIPMVDSEDTRKVRELLLEGFMQQMPMMINKAFRVAVKTYR